MNGVFVCAVPLSFHTVDYGDALKHQELWIGNASQNPCTTCSENSLREREKRTGEAETAREKERVQEERERKGRREEMSQ